MKFLGIDYGAKRIGIAMSDDNSKLAFPVDVLLNDKDVLKKIEEIIKTEKIEAIVVGESMNFAGEPNRIEDKINIFLQSLRHFNLPIIKQKEFLTTVEARRYHEGEVDSSAAALILQRYLDKMNTMDPRFK